MIRLFFISLVFMFFSFKVIADPFTREIGIIKQPTIEEKEIEEIEEVVEVIEEEIIEEEKIQETLAKVS